MTGYKTYVHIAEMESSYMLFAFCSCKDSPASSIYSGGIHTAFHSQFRVVGTGSASSILKDIDVSSQAVAMKNANPDAVLCSCAPEPAARFYTERKKLGWDVPVVNVFFGKSPKVAELAGADAIEGIHFATIFRDFDSPAPQIQQAKELLAKYYPEETPGAVHLWGFAGAQVFTEAMRRMGRDNITRDRLVETLEGIQNWTESVVPSISIGHGGAPEHFIVKDMSWVVFTNGAFQDFTP